MKEATNYGKWLHDMGGKWRIRKKMKNYLFYEYMQSGKYTLHWNVVTNKIKSFWTVRVPMKYGKWGRTMAGDRKV